MGPLCARALEPVSLQLKWTHPFQFAGYYAALEKGFYKEKGLAVTLLEGSPQEQLSVRTVLDGKATYGLAGSELFILPRLAEPGQDLTDFIYTDTVPLPFDWSHWGVRTGGLALVLAVSGGLGLFFYNRRMRAEICRRILSEAEREKLISELTQALEEVRELNGLLPICSICFKVRNDKGYWEKLESYIESHTKARFSHGICNDCMKERYPYLFEDEDSNGESDDFYNKESGTFPSGDG